MRFAIAALMTILLVGTIFAQDAQSAQDTTSAQDATSAQAPSQAPAAQAPAKAFSFKGGVNLGSDVLLTGLNGTAETWTRFGFQPDLSFGKIGVGIDLTFHFMLYPPDQNTALKVYDGDWVPTGNQDFLDVYLPKILYVRYGLKGEDPLFVKLGSINDLSLGNGFIMSEYSNMHFMPQQRIFGLDLGVDGTLFKFPYVGLELLTGNLAQFDVVGGRVFARPLVGTSIPILKNMQVGATMVVDNNPYLYSAGGSASPISAYGADVVVPILSGKLFPLALFTDGAVDPNQSSGWMMGLSGRLLGLFTYGAQVRVLQDGFIPAYFDANYDIYRAEKYNIPKGTGTYEGWYASIGTSLFTDKFIFNATLDGPFSGAGPVANPSSANQTDYPHLRGVMRLNEISKFPFYFDASYDKYKIGAMTDFFSDLVDPTDAVIGLNLNYKTGASVLTLAYDAKWDPAADSGKGKFNVTSSLQASMKF